MHGVSNASGIDLSDVVALIALLLSVVAIVWQAYTFRHEGSVVKVELNGAIIGYDPEPVVALSVTARNVGRTPVQVRGFSFIPEARRERTSLFSPRYRRLDATFVFPRPLVGSDPLPAVLDPGHSLSGSSKQHRSAGCANSTVSLRFGPASTSRLDALPRAAVVHRHLATGSPARRAGDGSTII